MPIAAILKINSTSISFPLQQHQRRRNADKQSQYPVQPRFLRRVGACFLQLPRKQRAVVRDMCKLPLRVGGAETLAEFRQQRHIAAVQPPALGKCGDLTAPQRGKGLRFVLTRQVE